MTFMTSVTTFDLRNAPLTRSAVLHHLNSEETDIMDETVAARRTRLVREIQRLREEIEYRLMLLVSGAQELEELAATEEGRPYRYVYPELSENTGGELRILSDDYPDDDVDMIGDHLSGLRR